MTNGDAFEIQLMARWLRANMTGCLFASHLANRIRPYVVRDREVLPNLPNDLAPWIAQYVSDDAVAMFIFPQMRTATEIAQLLTTLASHQDWSLSRPAWKTNPRQDLLLKLDFTTPHSQRSTPVGFAPLGSMPVVRRAPYVALALWPGKAANPYKQPTKNRVSLADTKLLHDEIDEQKYNAWFDESKANKERFLQGQDEGAAEHDVTFCLPREPGVLAKLPSTLLA